MKKIKIITVLSLVVLTSIVMVACKNNDNKGTLDSTISEQIKTDYRAVAESWYGAIGPDVNLDEISLTYLGTYSDAVVIVVWVSGPYDDAVWTCTVAGVTFSHSTYNPIIVWKNGSFYTLQESYDNELLTKQNLENVRKLWTSR